MTPDPRFMPGQPTLTYGPATHARFTWGDGNMNNTTTQIASSLP
jgi:hypothetical protein